MGYRGSKSRLVFIHVLVKEQRVDGFSIVKAIVRCTLVAEKSVFENDDILEIKDVHISCIFHNLHEIKHDIFIFDYLVICF